MESLNLECKRPRRHVTGSRRMDRPVEVTVAMRDRARARDFSDCLDHVTLTIYVTRYLMTGIVIANPITVIAPPCGYTTGGSSRGNTP